MSVQVDTQASICQAGLSGYSRSRWHRLHEGLIVVAVRFASDVAEDGGDISEGQRFAAGEGVTAVVVAVVARSDSGKDVGRRLRYILLRNTGNTTTDRRISNDAVGIDNRRRYFAVKIVVQEGVRHGDWPDSSLGRGVSVRLGEGAAGACQG